MPSASWASPLTNWLELMTTSITIFDQTRISLISRYLIPAGHILFVQGIDPQTVSTIHTELLMNDRSEENFEVDVEGYLDGAFPVGESEFGTTVLHVGVTSEHIRNQFFEMIFEILTVIAISWLVTFEFLVFYMRTRVSRPLNHIRTVLAEGVTRFVCKPPGVKVER